MKGISKNGFLTSTNRSHCDRYQGTNPPPHMAPKRKREVIMVTHCPTCGEAMDTMACGINWHAAYVAQRVKEHMIETGRIPTAEELEEIAESTGSDPCDDCCCGACGSRKAQPKTVAAERVARRVITRRFDARRACTVFRAGAKNIMLYLQ